MRFETLAAHPGKSSDNPFGSTSVPIYQTTNYEFEDIDKTRGYSYSRTSNPTRKALEDAIARLEGGKAGFAFASGMAAETTIIHLLKEGDHVVSGDDVYGGTYRLFQNIMSNFGLEFSFIRMDSRERIEEAIRPNTRMIWLETPSNPLMNITDIEMVADIARKYNLISVADSTFATPYFLRPFDYGVDLIVHSTTKYLNGHCDVTGGAVITNTDELTERMQFLLNAMGTCASPFDSWLVLRGIETLAVRMERHEKNAIKVAEYLESHPAVNRVFYPGLDSHPGNKIARKQMKGFSGMVSFELKGGIEAVTSFLRKIKVITLAESLGGVGSLAEHPTTMSHASMPEEMREKVGITEGLVRLSVGLENIDDIIEDLDKAL
jgi:cystathionine beta-lyase/cystathionine gamma-synthase